ncbi:MAG: MFS transporter [Phycisphaerae bacterium]|jgi:MFS family permease
MTAPPDGLSPAQSPELAAYYADKPLMWRNVMLIGLCNIGWGMVAGVVGPLIALRLLELGFRENFQATINSGNMLVLSVLVMYLGWKSDHTVSRFGRRKPFLFLSAPFIIGSIALFPLFDKAHLLWVLVLLNVTSLFFMDIKSSTFPLLSIDCVPREILARANSVLAIASGLVGFVAMRYAGDLIHIAEWFPFALGAGIMTVTTICSLWIQEPPIRYPTTERFQLWSTFKVASRDKRIFWLMAGVAMIHGYMVMNGMWIWFWARETLGLDRGEIFAALSWAGLLNIVLAYPTGWVIDRFGGFRVVIVYWAGQLACYLWALNVHDKSGLIILSLATTMIGPLYTAADIMVYKSAPRHDVGSYTSTNSFLRNAYLALLGLVAGWVIYSKGHNFVIGFSIGMAMSTVGLVLFLIHHRLMSRNAEGPSSETVPIPTEISSFPTEPYESLQN